MVPPFYFIMKKILFSLIISIFININTVWADYSTTVKTIEGVEIQVSISETYKEAKIKSRESQTSAIDKNTEGTVTIPTIVDGYPVTSIGNYAFRDCSKITKLVLPSTLSSVDDGCVRGCYALEEITMSGTGNTVQCIGNCILQYSDMYEGWELTAGTKKSVIPNNVKRISRYAFELTAIQQVNIPSSVTLIEEEAFALCEELTSLTFFEGLIEIGRNSFIGCGKLTQIEFPSTLQTIGAGAFAGTSLKSIFIPANVSRIGQFGYRMSINSFPASTLEKIEVDENNATYDSRDNCNAIILKNSYLYGTALVSGCKNTKIPEGIELIWANAFFGCPFSSVSIPSSVQTISSNAFHNCENLESLYIPASVVNISNDAFSNCSGLKSIIVEDGNIKYDSRDNCNALIIKDFEYSYFDGEEYKERIGACLLQGSINTKIPEGVEVIADDAFSCIQDLKSLVIPSSIRRIGSAFTNSGLETVYSYIEEPYDLGGNQFNIYESDGYLFGPSTLYVPKGTKEKYLEKEGWRLFRNIYEMGDANSIADIKKLEMQTEVYTLSGMRQKSMTQGLNIIRKSDGTSYKVLIK